MEETMLRKLFILTAIITASALAGCSTTSLENNWGKSFTAAKNNQILHPEASENLDLVEGLDGQAAAQSLTRFRAGFGGDKQKSGYSKNPLFGVVSGPGK
jgi:hypothetical protein